jgi:hypothetical protein
MTDDLNNINRLLTRRDTLTAGGTALTTLLAGCSGGGSDPEPTEPSTDTPASSTTDTTEVTDTDTTTEETTTQAEPKNFNEIYMETVNEPWEQEGEEFTAALRPYQIDKYEDEDRFDSFDDMMVELKDDILNNWTVINDSQELTKHLQHALHNDLGFDPDEVRVLGRDMAGGGTYTAIMHRNDNGDWVKDLALPSDGKDAYLGHNDTEDDIDFSDEASRGLWNIWKRDDPTTVSATDYPTLTDLNWEEAEEDSNEWVMERISKGNDHIVVGEPYEKPTVGYTVEAAQRVSGKMDWHENDTFNEEMAVVEQATEAYHNSSEEFLKMKMQDGEVTAVPTEEYTGPENLYNN